MWSAAPVYSGLYESLYRSAEDIRPCASSVIFFYLFNGLDEERTATTVLEYKASLS
jgi:hypothetical protein